MIRHQVFRWIRSAWNDQVYQTWAAFAAVNGDGFGKIFQGKPLSARFEASQ